MKNFIFLYSIIFVFSTQLMAQTIMNIHQSNGTVLQIPLNTIDSITYTTNSSGSISNPGPGISYNGYNYPTVILGNGQEWMAQNLRTTQYSDGTTIPLVTDSLQWASNFNNSTNLPMMCWYNNDQATYTANNFGALYNWYAINPLTNGNKNVCPTGWHVPTDSQYLALANYLYPNASGKMRSTGTQYWQSPNAGATNESGFSGLPGGLRNDLGVFEHIGYDGYWYTTTEMQGGLPISLVLVSTSNDIIFNMVYKNNAFSVRCLKD